MNEPDRPFRPKTLDGIILWRFCSLPWPGFTVISMAVAVALIGLSTFSAFPSMSWASGFKPASIVCMLFSVLSVPTALAAWLIGKLAGYPVRLIPSWKERILSGGILALAILFFMVPMSAVAMIKGVNEVRKKQQWTPYPLANDHLTVELPATFVYDKMSQSGSEWCVDDVRGLMIRAVTINRHDLVDSNPTTIRNLMMEGFAQGVQNPQVVELQDFVDGEQTATALLTYEEGNARHSSVFHVQRAGAWIVELRFIAAPSAMDPWQNEMKQIAASISEVGDERSME